MTQFKAHQLGNSGSVLGGQLNAVEIEKRYCTNNCMSVFVVSGNNP
jgi:hypothetical protein